jgi:hypothetical protein
VRRFRIDARVIAAVAKAMTATMVQTRPADVRRKKVIAWRQPTAKNASPRKRSAAKQNRSPTTTTMTTSPAGAIVSDLSSTLPRPHCAAGRQHGHREADDEANHRNYSQQDKGDKRSGGQHGLPQVAFGVPSGR